MLITEIYDMNHGIHRNKFPNVFLVLTSKKNQSHLRIKKHEFTDNAYNCDGSFATDENVQN